MARKRFTVRGTCCPDVCWVMDGRDRIAVCGSRKNARFIRDALNEIMIMRAYREGLGNYPVKGAKKVPVAARREGDYGGTKFTEAQKEIMRRYG